MYPIEKYRYFTNGNKTIAISTYAGKTVRGVAICDPGDQFDPEKGKQLAASRCAIKIAEKRLNRARLKVKEADKMCLAAEDHYDKMCEYAEDAFDELDEALAMEKKLLESF